MRELSRHNFAAAGLTALLLSALQGCVALTAEVPRPRPDPLAKEAVRVVEVAGATLRLGDGRRFDLAGVDVGGLTAEQRAKFEGQLRATLAGSPVLLDDVGGGRARFVLSLPPVYPRPPNWEGPHVITLIPVQVDYYPRRLDLATDLVRRGMAKADLRGLDRARPLPFPTVSGRAIVPPPEIPPDQPYGDVLRNAEDDARSAHQGLFQRPVELLLSAVRHHDKERVETLLAAGADVNAVSCGTDALAVACGEGDAAMVALLLDRGASASVTGTASPYDWGFVHQDVILLLLERGVPVPAGETAARVLINSVTHEDPRALELALKQGVSPDGSISTWTPLMYAAERGQLAAARLLLEYGADPGRKNSAGQAALDLAPHDPGLRSLLGALAMRKREHPLEPGRALSP